jgi:hypothetical protein
MRRLVLSHQEQSSFHEAHVVLGGQWLGSLTADRVRDLP